MRGAAIVVLVMLAGCNENETDCAAFVALLAFGAFIVWVCERPRR